MKTNKKSIKVEKSAKKLFSEPGVKTIAGGIKGKKPRISRDGSNERHESEESVCVVTTFAIIRSDERRK